MAEKEFQWNPHEPHCVNWTFAMHVDSTKQI